VRRIVCFGDSLTSGHGIASAAAYPALLHQKVRRAGLPFEVVNAGVSRSTSGDALVRLDSALQGDVRVLVVALGVNDGLRGVPVPQIKANLGRVIEDCVLSTDIWVRDNERWVSIRRHSTSGIAARIWAWAEAGAAIDSPCPPVSR